MKSLYLLDILKEGVYDPAIFKLLFIIGGPGSGKSFFADRIGVTAMGFVAMDPDVAFEHLMKKAGLDIKMPDSEEAERTIVRDKATELTGKKQGMAIDGRLGIYVGGTGHDYNKLIALRKKFETIGYDAFMVVVNTSLDVARERNNKRHRSLPDKVVVQKWHAAQENLDRYEESFKDNFAVINGDQMNVEEVDRVRKQIAKFAKTPPTRPQARQWIEAQKAAKKRP